MAVTKQDTLVTLFVYTVFKITCWRFAGVARPDNCCVITERYTFAAVEHMQ